jgi:hypothetical protein
MSLAKLRMNCNRKENGGSMKKLIVSLMLIAMSAFAAESAPSSTVGYVKYSNITTSGTDFNRISIPVNNGWTMSNHINPNGSMFRSISRWEPSTQAWVSSNWFSGTTWLSTFAVSAGQSYQINAYVDHDLIVNGPVVNSTGYNFITTSGTDFNFFMVPLHKSSLTTTQLLGNDIGSNCNSLTKWNATTQSAVTSNRFGTGSTWLSTYATEIGMPLMANVIGNVSWGSYSKEGSSEEATENDQQYNTPKGNPRTIYAALTDKDGAKYDFPAEFGTGLVTLKAWITARPTDILNENSPDVAAFDMDPLAVVQVNIGNFANPWIADDVLNIKYKDELGGLHKVYYEADWSMVLDASGDAVYVGFDFYFSDGSFPLVLNSPSSIEDSVVPAETKLHQNYPNPFNPTTTIKFDLAKESVVKLNVYNYNGQLVKSLVDGQMNAGFHSVNFDASSLSAGVYYYTMETAGMTKTQKMVLVK